MFMSRMSSASSVLRTWSSVQSLHSIRYVAPGATVLAGGMSGCQRLCPGTVWSRIDTLRSRLISKITSGTGTPQVSANGMDGRSCSEARPRNAHAGVDPGRPGRRGRDVAVEDAGRDVAGGAGVGDAEAAAARGVDGR